MLEGKLYGYSLALGILLIPVRFKKKKKHYSHFSIFLIKFNFIRLVSVLHMEVAPGAYKQQTGSG